MFAVPLRMVLAKTDVNILHAVSCLCVHAVRSSCQAYIILAACRKERCTAPRVINPQRAHAQRGLPSVTAFSSTTRNKQVKKRHQRVQRYTAIFVKVARSEVMAWKRSEQTN